MRQENRELKFSSSADSSRSSGKPERPRAYLEGIYPWSIRRVPHTLQVGGEDIPHPGRTCAIFVVHGIGEQAWTETAAQLRSGFEEALTEIARWQRDNSDPEYADLTDKEKTPPPFVWEGCWANYESLEETFEQDWQHFNDRERDFFTRLWKLRTHSVWRTLRWTLGQQVRLLSFRVLREVGPFAWLIYLPLQIVSTTFRPLSQGRRTGENRRSGSKRRSTTLPERASAICDAGKPSRQGGFPV